MKSYVIFGCGRFGSAIAQTLVDLGNEVMVIDENMDKLETIADKVTTAIQADLLDETETSSIGLNNFDGAVVAIGSNFEAAIMATVLAKEAGIPYIAVKAVSNRQGLILKRVGASKVIYPERDMGIRVARDLSKSKLVDYIELSTNYSIAKFDSLPEWRNKSLIDLNFRKKYKVTVLAIERKEISDLVDPNPETIIKDGDVLVIIGHIENLQKLEKKAIKDENKN